MEYQIQKYGNNLRTQQKHMMTIENKTLLTFIQNMLR